MRGVARQVAGMWFWRRHKRLDEYLGVAVGQRFRATGSIPIMWEVEAFARHPGEMNPHVRLHRVGIPSEAKTISLHILRDKRFYEPAP